MLVRTYAFFSITGAKYILHYNSWFYKLKKLIKQLMDSKKQVHLAILALWENGLVGHAIVL